MSRNHLNLKKFFFVQKGRAGIFVKYGAGFYVIEKSRGFELEKVWFYCTGGGLCFCTGGRDGVFCSGGGPGFLFRRRAGFSVQEVGRVFCTAGGLGFLYRRRAGFSVLKEGGVSAQEEGRDFCTKRTAGVYV